MNQRILYAIALGAAVIAALFAFVPELRQFIWLGIFWGIVAVSVVTVVGVIVNILSVMVSMYTGYPSTKEPDTVERRASPPVASCAVKPTTGEVLQFSGARATGGGVVEERLDAIGELYRAGRFLICKAAVCFWPLARCRSISVISYLGTYVP